MSEVSASGLLKQAKRLKRRVDRERFGSFIAEGPQVLQMAIDRKAQLIAIFTCENENLDFFQNKVSVPVFHISDTEFREISDTVTPQGILAIAKIPSHQISEISKTAKLLLYIEEIRDPGNLGTIIRTADAAGAGAVLLSPGSVDPYNSKCVRSSAGSVFNLPIINNIEISDLVELASAINANILVTALEAESSIYQIDSMLSKPTIWAIGNEAVGVSDALKSAATQLVRIPMLGKAESLNAAIAAAVCLFASAEQLNPNKV
jgi:TrmH family RNA methyltransferase